VDFKALMSFFVISGFLMTGLAVSGLEKSGLRYSIFDFHLARARWIVPALVVVCMSLVLMGWWVLPAPDYRKLADHASLTCCSCRT
jgi:peptidoglycan/LPS O-acetylase OafA/YrhL